MKIYRLAQEVEEIFPDDVEGLLWSFDTKRFKIGYRKANGEHRDMTCQRHVKRPYQGGDMGGVVPEGLLVVYDLQIASQIAKKALSEMDVNDYDPAILKKAYRRIYPQNVEYIRGGGKEYVVVHDEMDEDQI